VDHPGDHVFQSVSSAAASARPRVDDAAPHTTNISTAVVAVPVLSLRPADSPRLNGEDKAHIMRLAETETGLPPILVDRRTMRVIDGMHRLMAASLQGRETIDVIFFEGDTSDIFLRAVQENVTHGLPLSQSDRRAAAERIIASHPHMSDRAIGQTAGLAAKTIAAIRKNSGDKVPQSDVRVGRDGRVRPLDGVIGRRRAAELMAAQPDASLRDVARVAGISPATALDVRKRLERGESPVPNKQAGRTGQANAAVTGATADNEVGGQGNRANDGNAIPVPLPLGLRPASRVEVPPDLATTVEKLMRDPSLRGNEQGKSTLRLLHVNAVGAGQLPTMAAALPPHCVAIIVQLAQQYATMWRDFAWELDRRARIIDPVGRHPLPRAADRLPIPEPPGCRSPSVDVPHGGHHRALLTDGADYHSLGIEQRRDQPVLKLQVPTALVAVAFHRAGRFGHGQRLERSVNEQSRVAFHVPCVVAVIVDAVRVVGERREAEEQRGRDFDRPLAIGGLDHEAFPGRGRRLPGCGDRFAKGDVLLLFNNDTVVLQDLMFHHREGQPTGPALLFLDGDHAAAFGSRFTAPERPIRADSAAGPHPAASQFGRSGNRLAQRAPVRAEVGLRGPVEQVEPMPQ
jgi:ParB-like chromosome segregation protein Spo0J